jgi:hypothetical protein
MPNFTRIAAKIQIRLLAPLLARMGPGNRAWLARHMMQDRRDPGARAFAEFAQKAIDLVQFEYGEINLKTRDFL